ncbi:MAG: pilus assembly FimT family protein, partial [Planctomycetota bacterium]
RHQRGFSFIELLAVIAIMSLILGFVVLKIDHLIPSERISAAARKIGSTNGLARAQAVATGTRHALTYDLNRQRYAVLIPPHPEEIEEGRAKRDDLFPLTWHPLPEGVKILNVQLGDSVVSSGSVRVIFSPLGTATPHAVQLQGQDDAELTVVINPLTGLIEIEEGLQELDLFADPSDFSGGLSGGGF